MGMAILVPGVAGVLLGNAVALALMARGMREWQRREGALLLREPRYRTARAGRTHRSRVPRSGRLLPRRPAPVALSADPQLAGSAVPGQRIEGGRVCPCGRRP